MIINFVPAGQTQVTGDPALRPDIRQAAAESTTAVTTAAILDTHNCPSGNSVHWYCLYEHADFRGHMAQFKDCNANGYVNDLADYGWQNRATSWVNTRTAGSVQALDTKAGRLWTEGSRSSASNVGTANNDRADKLKCFTS